MMIKIPGKIKARFHIKTVHIYIRLNLLELISYISQYFTLEEGDLILTGTPAGVGPVRSGDEIEAEIPNISKISFNVTQRF